MEQKIKIAVLGGGGRTGNHVVTQLLSQGYNIKLLLRNPENFSLKSPLIEIIKGDAIDAEAIHSLIQGCQAIISTVGQRKDEPLVASQATINILKAMAAFGIQRYILVAGLNIDTPFDKKSSETRIATEWMKENFPLIHNDRQKTYSILSTSNVNWTLVRVPFIDFTGEKSETIVSLEDCLGKKISATDIATFLAEQLSDDTYFKKSPFIANA
ncbi:MAG: NAD(P)H-binding protein [Bacteroidota bacterium]